MVKGLSEVSGMDASHGDSALFGPHLNPALPIPFLLSAYYARSPLMHLDFQKFVRLKLGQQSGSPTFDKHYGLFNYVKQ